MNRREALARAWPALLKLAEKGAVSIYFRGLTDTEKPLYELKGLAGASSGLLTEPQLLDSLASEKKEGK